MTQVCCCCPCIHDLLVRTTRRVRMEDEAHERERHAAALQSRLNAGSAPRAEDYFKQHDSYICGDATTTPHSRSMAESSRAATTTTKAERQLERQRLLSERAALSDGPTPRSPSSRDHTYRGAASRGLQLYETFMAAFRDAISSPRSKRATGPWSSFKWTFSPKINEDLHAEYATHRTDEGWRMFPYFLRRGIGRDTDRQPGASAEDDGGGGYVSRITMPPRSSGSTYPLEPISGGSPGVPGEIGETGAAATSAVPLSPEMAAYQEARAEWAAAKQAATQKAKEEQAAYAAALADWEAAREASTQKSLAEQAAYKSELARYEAEGAAQAAAYQKELAAYELMVSRAREEAAAKAAAEAAAEAAAAAEAEAKMEAEAKERKAANGGLGRLDRWTLRALLKERAVKRIIDVFRELDSNSGAFAVPNFRVSTACCLCPPHIRPACGCGRRTHTQYARANPLCLHVPLRPPQIRS